MPRIPDILFPKTTVPRTLCMGFAAIITIGALLLMLPIANSDGRWGNVLVSFFTSTSAVCVTGLVVVDTGTYFSLFGQVVIMLLIQLGGLGYMTITSLLILMIGRKFSLKDRIAIQQALDTPGYGGIHQFIKSIFVVTAIIEFFGALLLLPVFLGQYSISRGLWMAVFHSVSAFNNAGFGLLSDNLASYVSSPLVNIVICGLIIVGGIGYHVIVEAYVYARSKINPNIIRRTFSLNFLVVTRTTLFLIIVGTVVIWVLERHNPGSIGGLCLRDQVMASWFQAVTARTAGFNTIDEGKLGAGALFVSIALMFVGGSPGGTAGGIKTATAWVLYSATKAILEGRDSIIAHGRRIPPVLVLKAIGVCIGSALTVLIATLIIVTEHPGVPFINSMFEVVSAFGTVGLSTGITPNLSALSKVVLIATMYIGRVGILIIMAAVVGDPQPRHVRYPDGQLLVG